MCCNFSESNLSKRYCLKILGAQASVLAKRCCTTCSEASRPTCWLIVSFCKIVANFKNPTISPFGKFWLKITLDQFVERYISYFPLNQHKHTTRKESRKRTFIRGKQQRKNIIAS